MSRQAKIRALRTELGEITREAAALVPDSAIEVLSLPIPNAVLTALDRAHRKAEPGQNAFVLWPDVIAGGTDAKIIVVTVQDYDDFLAGTKTEGFGLPERDGMARR